MAQPKKNSLNPARFHAPPSLPTDDAARGSRSRGGVYKKTICPLRTSLDHFDGFVFVFGRWREEKMKLVCWRLVIGK
jgi:hypothetical protein